MLYEHLLAQGIPGVIELTPGVRSLQVQFDPAVLTMAEVTDLLAHLDGELPASDQLVMPSRTVRLPLSWDDPATHEAIQRYTHGVRADISSSAAPPTSGTIATPLLPVRSSPEHRGCCGISTESASTQ